MLLTRTTPTSPPIEIIRPEEKASSIGYVISQAKSMLSGINGIVKNPIRKIASIIR